MAKRTTSKPTAAEKADEKALGAAMGAAEQAGGMFIKCQSLDHSTAMNNFGNASAILTILAENQDGIEKDELNAALWGIRRLINHGLELLGEDKVQP
jgi:hypothetical protein